MYNAEGPTYTTVYGAATAQWTTASVSKNTVSGRFSGDLVLVPFTVVAPTGVGGRRRVCTAGAGIRGKPPG